MNSTPCTHYVWGAEPVVDGQKQVSQALSGVNGGPRQQGMEDSALRKQSPYRESEAQDLRGNLVPPFFAAPSQRKKGC